MKKSTGIMRANSACVRLTSFDSMLIWLRQLLNHLKEHQNSQDNTNYSVDVNQPCNDSEQPAYNGDPAKQRSTIQIRPTNTMPIPIRTTSPPPGSEEASVAAASTVDMLATFMFTPPDHLIYTTHFAFNSDLFRLC